MGHTVSGEVPGARKLDTFVTGHGSCDAAGRCPPPRTWWAPSLAPPRSQAVPLLGPGPGRLVTSVFGPGEGAIVGSIPPNGRLQG